MSARPDFPASNNRRPDATPTKEELLRLLQLRAARFSLPELPRRERWQPAWETEPTFSLALDVFHAAANEASVLSDQIVRESGYGHTALEAPSNELEWRYKRAFEFVGHAEMFVAHQMEAIIELRILHALTAAGCAPPGVDDGPINGPEASS